MPEQETWRQLIQLMMIIMIIIILTIMIIMTIMIIIINARNQEFKYIRSLSYANKNKNVQNTKTWIYISTPTPS